MRRALLCVFAGLLAGACQSESPEKEVEAARALLSARDIEFDLARLPEAVAKYEEIAAAYSGAPSAARAADRARELSAIAAEAGEVVASEADTVAQACRRLLALAPYYPPLMDRLGRAHYITTQLWARAAPAMAEYVNADHVVRIWAAQDSLFSSYPFGSNHKDTEMADLLCRQSVDVARMLEELRRYDEALAVVNRGMAYGKTKDALMQASVYASFYTYRAGKAREAIDLATRAAEYEPLAGNLKARAQHVIGLSYFSLFEDSARVGDLEASIKALNGAVTIDPSMSEARQMLQTLREHRERLSSSAS